MSWLDFPTVAFPENLMKIRQGSYQLRPAGQVLGVGSPFSQITRVVSNTAQLWTAELQGNLAQGYEISAFVSSLNGLETLFRMHDPAVMLPQGVAGGWDPSDGAPLYFDDGAGGFWSFSSGYALTSGETVVLVAADAARGDLDLHIKGLVPSQTTAFKPGDRFELGKNLYEVLRPTPSDAAGETRVLIRPALRRGAIVDDPINLWKPRARFMLVTPDEGAVQNLGEGYSSFSLRAIEVPYYQ